MRVPIDKAGRLVIPKVLRDEVGLTAGDVEILCDGAGIRIEPMAGAGLKERRGRLVIPAVGVRVDDDGMQALRDADQR